MKVYTNLAILYFVIATGNTFQAYAHPSPHMWIQVADWLFVAVFFLAFLVCLYFRHNHFHYFQFGDRVTYNKELYVIVCLKPSIYILCKNDGITLIELSPEEMEKAEVFG